MHGSSYLGTTEIYNGATGSSSWGPNLAQNMYGICATDGINGDIFLIGGRVAGSTSQKIVKTYNFATTQWTNRVNMQTARIYAICSRIVIGMYSLLEMGTSIRSS